MRIRRILGIACISVLALLIARLSFAFYRFHAVERNFDAIHNGDSRESVISRFGNPNYHSGDCLYDLHVAPDCSSELVYSNPLAPWLPEYYVVDFSPEGKVIATANLNSP